MVSHPQATAQCARFLRERLPQAERVTADSTAEAVRRVRDGDEPLAALGSRLSAELYGCEILAENVEDHPDNLTRFVWLARADEVADPAPPAKTSVVFWGFNDESPGALVDVLDRVRGRARSTSRASSRGRAGCASATTCSSPTSRARSARTA